MVWKYHEYEDIPGTYVFNGERSGRGYRINKMAFSFNEESNRNEFANDMAHYCDKFELSDEEKKAILDADFTKLLELGGNIYYLAKIATFHGMNMQDAGARMSGITPDEFRARLKQNSLGFKIKLLELGGYFGG